MKVRKLCVLLSVTVLTFSSGLEVVGASITQQKNQVAVSKGNQNKKNYWNMSKEEKKNNKDLKKELKNQVKELAKSQYTEEEIKALLKLEEELLKNHIDIRVLKVDSIISNKGKFKFDVPPVIKGNRTLIPVRAITEGLGAEVEWFPAEEKVVVKKGDIVIELWLGSPIAKVNGQSVTMETKVEKYSNRVFVPLRFIAETFKLEVIWDPDDDTIEIIVPEYNLLVNNTFNEIIFDFEKNIKIATHSLAAVKERIFLAENGTTFRALTSQDQVSIVDGNLVVKLYQPLQTSSNKLMILAETLKYDEETVLDEIITSVIDASPLKTKIYKNSGSNTVRYIDDNTIVLVVGNIDYRALIDGLVKHHSSQTIEVVNGREGNESAYTSSHYVVPGSDYVRVKAADGTTKYYAIKGTLAAPSGLSVVDATNTQIKNGAIIGVNSAMEYKKEGETNYKSINTNVLGGLGHGVYLIRYKAIEHYVESDVVQVYVGVVN